MDTYKPVIPNWVRIVFPVMQGIEAAAIFFGFPVVTGGLSGWIGASLYLALVYFFRLTPFPIIATPIAVIGAYAAFHIPWVISVPFFVWPYIYNWFFVRDYYARTKHLSSRYQQGRFSQTGDLKIDNTADDKK